MTKDVDLFVSEAVTAGTSAEVIGAVLDVWRAADRAMPDSDFTEIWKFVSRVGEVDVAEKVQRGRRRAQLSQG
jgi:hypothetical protein